MKDIGHTFLFGAIFILFYLSNLVSMQKGPDRFGLTFQEILTLLKSLNMSKRPYMCHALGWSLCLSQGCDQWSNLSNLWSNQFNQWSI